MLIILWIKNISMIDSKNSIVIVQNFYYGESPHQIEAKVIQCGSDYIVVVGGSTFYHIGAIAVAICQPSIKDTNRLTTTVSIISVPGHKEDQLARTAAYNLSKILITTVTVCVGIHIDNAKHEDIIKLEENFHGLFQNIEKYFLCDSSLK